MNTPTTDQEMSIVYQPIVHLQSGKTLGYEALARFSSGETPDKVFKSAWDKSDECGVDLEVRAFEQAIRDFPAEIDEAYLAINASAKTIIATRGALVKDPGLEVPWPRIVLEISEKEQVSDYQPLSQALGLLLRHQVRLSIDDLGGAGFSGYGHMLQVLPHFTKIDREVIKHLDENPIKRALVEGIVVTAQRIHSTVIAEGIETKEEKEWCTGLGVDCGQGYFFGKPETSPRESRQDSN